MTPAYDVASFIAANVAGLTLGANLKVGEEETPYTPGQSALSVNVADTGGIDATPFVDGGERTRLERPGVNLRIRGDKDDVATLRSIATTLVDVLDRSSIAPWKECVVTGGQAFGLGRDDDGFPNLAIGLRLLGFVEQFPMYGGAAAVPGVIDEAWILATLSPFSRGRRNLTYATVALAGDRLWAAFPQAWSGPSAAPPKLFDGFGSKTPIASVLLAASVPVVVRGAAVLYDVHASAAGVAAGAHIAKVL